jgi:hypothetical protein
MVIAVDAETETIARHLAALRGQSIEAAVSGALRAELERAQAEGVAKPARALTPAQLSKIEHMMTIVSALPHDDGEEAGRTAFLYDENGLPH